jgi:hypothetical protein
MSLSPEQFENSIGGLGVKGGSVLVMATGDIIGVSPCGCDGWALVIDPDGYVRTNMGMEKGEIVFPPTWDYKDGPMAESRELAAAILELLDRHMD